MRKMSFKRLALLLSCFALVGTVYVREASSQEASQKWQAKMRGLYQTLAELTTDVTSDKRFDSPTQRGRIDRNAKKLSDLAHDLTRSEMTAPDSDPTVKMMAALFQEQTQLAYLALRTGNRAYARGLLTGISSYCIACHTRNTSGPSFSSLPLAPDAKDLSLTDQGRFFAATRQFDRALETFQKVVASPSGVSSFDWNRSAQAGLAIAVRVKNDPDLAATFVERILESKGTPFFMKVDAAQWKKSIEQWRAEIPRQVKTEDGLYAEAQRLVSLAHETQRYPADHSADLIYFRASSVIHELLQVKPESRYTEQAFLLAGVCYEALAPGNLEDLHELYYEACIRRAPGSPTAETCFKRYEQSVFFGYTGSAGTSLPRAVQEKLRRLQILALPELPKRPN